MPQPVYPSDNIPVTTAIPKYSPTEQSSPQRTRTCSGTRCQCVTKRRLSQSILLATNGPSILASGEGGVPTIETIVSGTTYIRKVKVSGLVQVMESVAIGKDVIRPEINEDFFINNNGHSESNLEVTDRSSS